MKITIKDVANEAGVSIATVSRVLNDKGSISAATVDKVMHAIQRLNYQTGPFNRKMMTPGSKMIGLLVPKLSNEYWSLVSEIIQEELWNEGYSLLVCYTNREFEKESATINMFINTGVEGIIYGGSSYYMGEQNDYSHIENAKKNNVPIVSLSPYIPNIHCVVGDHLQGATDAVTHLIKQGHRNIAYIGGPAVSVERELGYRKAFRMNGLEVNERLVKIGNSESTDFGDQAMAELMAGGEPFSAVFCGNDAIALGTMNTLQSAGKRIPEDIAVLGYDDIKLAKLVKPALTTVRQPLREMSKAVIKLIFDIKQDPILNYEPRTILFQMELIIRESCKLSNLVPIQQTVTSRN